MEKKTGSNVEESYLINTYLHLRLHEKVNVLHIKSHSQSNLAVYNTNLRKRSLRYRSTSIHHRNEDISSVCIHLLLSTPMF